MAAGFIRKVAGTLTAAASHPRFNHLIKIRAQLPRYDLDSGLWEPFGLIAPREL